MVKQIKYLLIFILIVLVGCNRTQQKKSKIRYSGYRVSIGTGKPIEIRVDSVTPLNKLITRLGIQNKLYDTNTRDLIGYNDLMFSIAVHGDSAIEPLIRFIHTTKLHNAKIAAVYTLHLIGKDCITSYDGMFEVFPNLKARKALFRLLAEDDSLQPRIMQLLSRRPMASDVPVLFDILNSSKSDCWAITCGLVRYNLRNIPVAQKLPKKIWTKQVHINNPNGDLNDIAVSKMMKRISTKYRDFVVVEDTLLNYHYELPIGHDGYTSCPIIGDIITIGNLCHYCTFTNPFQFGSNFQYYYTNDKITFCSPRTTKHLWLEWWKSQTHSYIDSLKSSEKIIATFRDINL
jgi:hypothetical protein